MRFRDRREAGLRLAEALEAYTGQKDAIVLGLPRGGVVLAFEVAKTLALPLDVTCPHKIGAPHQPELAIGAITESGEGHFNEKLCRMLGVPHDYIEMETKRRAEQARQRLKLYREEMGPRALKGKTVLIIDDGLATGATMKAAIASVRVERPAKIVAAVPISPPDTLAEIKALADEVVCLDAPASFQAVGQFYEDFAQTTDDEVIELMRAAQ
jgi:putative phosphoribosyl transferase